MHRAFTIAVALVSLLRTSLPLPAMSAAPGFPSLFVEGDAETVFSWRTDRCDDQDIPDAPARAFRDAAGRVHLFATHFRNRALTGPRLGAVAADCRIAFEGHGSDDPAAFDDRIWLTAFHTDDGKTVHALGHAEFHGHLRRTLCPSGHYMDCWWNSIVQAVSTDGGKTFRRTGGPANGLVAALPYPYDATLRRPTGYFSPTNIVARDGYLYTFVFAGGRDAQQRGACLLRTDDIGEPTRWRAWDGSGFAVRFVNPYATEAHRRPENHVCAPIPGIASTLTSLVRVEDGTFLGLTAGKRPLVPGGAPVTGVYVSSSPDLLHWSEPRLLLALPMMFDFPCDAATVWAYPSLLDENSPSATFETIGRRPHLYLTRFNVRNCRLSMDRDLVRFRVGFEIPASLASGAAGATVPPVGSGVD